MNSDAAAAALQGSAILKSAFFDMTCLDTLCTRVRQFFAPVQNSAHAVDTTLIPSWNL